MGRQLHKQMLLSIVIVLGSLLSLTYATFMKPDYGYGKGGGYGGYSKGGDYGGYGKGGGYGGYEHASPVYVVPIIAPLHLGDGYGGHGGYGGGYGEHGGYGGGYGGHGGYGGGYGGHGGYGGGYGGHGGYGGGYGGYGGGHTYYASSYLHHGGDDYREDMSPSPHVQVTHAADPQLVHAPQPQHTMPAPMAQEMKMPMHVVS